MSRVCFFTDHAPRTNGDDSAVDHGLTTRAVLGRKKAVNDWSDSRLMRHIVACYVTNPELDPVKATTILDQEPASLPKKVWKAAEEAGRRDWTAFTGIPRYVVFFLDPPDEYRAAVLSEGAYVDLVRDWKQCCDLAQAHAEAAA
jgi:hypothetical protein